MAQLCGTPPVAPLTCAVEAALTQALHYNEANRVQAASAHAPFDAADAPQALFLRAAAAAAGDDALLPKATRAGGGGAAAAAAAATSVDIDGALLVGTADADCTGTGTSTWAGGQCWRIKTWEQSRLNIWKRFPSTPLTRAEGAAARDTFAKAAAEYGVPASRARAVWSQHRKALVAAHGKAARAVPMLLMAQPEGPGLEYDAMPVFLAMPFELFLQQASRRALEMNAEVTIAAAREALMMLRA